LPSFDEEQTVLVEKTSPENYKQIGLSLTQFNMEIENPSQRQNPSALTYICITDFRFLSFHTFKTFLLTIVAMFIKEYLTLAVN